MEPACSRCEGDEQGRGLSFLVKVEGKYIIGALYDPLDLGTG
jgi:hypothetical protein